MRSLSVIALLACYAVLGFAQDERKDIVCNSTPATTIGQEAEVIMQKVVVTGEWGSNEITVYLPDKHVADSAVLISHSTIHADGGESAEMRIFALTLAHAGAAVVVLQRTLMWPPADRSTNRAGAPVICAEQWLVDHINVVNNGEPTVNENKDIVRYGYAYVGPRVCDPVVVADCSYTMPFFWDCVRRKRNCPAVLGVPIGETEGGDSTRGMLSGEALRSTQWLHERLNLARSGATVSPKPRPES